MNADLEFARQVLRDRGAGFVAVKTHLVVAEGHDHGIGSLIGAAEQLRERGLTQAALADSVAGRAAMLVAAWAGIACVHADLISDAALGEAARHQIPTTYSRRVPVILNRRGDGPCPFEISAAEADAAGLSLEETVARLREVARAMVQRRSEPPF